MAERFLSVIAALQMDKSLVHISLEGGRISEKMLLQVAQKHSKYQVDWDRLHFWWGDERFLAMGDPARNVEQAKRCLLDRVPVPAENIHSAPPDNGVITVAEAAQEYAAELARWQGTSTRLPAPSFDICILGMGPDGHTASLFPGSEQIKNTYEDSQRVPATVLPVTGSPKPPPQRTTLSYASINASQRVWVEVSGSDKAVALKLALEGASPFEVPVAGVQGKVESIIFADNAATSVIAAEML